MDHPVTIGSYMNEPDIINNKYQLHQAMKSAANWLPTIYEEYEEISGRSYGAVSYTHLDVYKRQGRPCRWIRCLQRIAGRFHCLES